MAQVHLFNGVGQSRRFIPVHTKRCAGLHVAEPTGAGTDLSQDHEGSGTSSPAFCHVGAFTAHTDGVQFLPGDDLLHIEVLFALWQ